MTHKTLSFIILFGLLCTGVGCGGSSPAQPEPVNAEDLEIEEESKLTAEDYQSRAVLARAELTDEVDEKRFRAIGDILTEFSPGQRLIYFVGHLRSVPTQAEIQVHWFKNNVPEPMLISDVTGSDKFSFISTFRPQGRRFIPGKYTVKVMVNDRNVGETDFTILGKDPMATGLTFSNLKISSKINKKMRPVKPMTHFKKNPETAYLTFSVKNAVPAKEVIVKWYRQGDLFSESVLRVEGNGRFSADVTAPSGLPDGAYKAEINLDGNAAATTRFSVGTKSDGPTVKKVAVGLALGPDAMPIKDLKKFKYGTEAIYCGVRFVDLEPNSIITIEWNMVDGESESTYHTVNTPVPSGGSGTMGADWSPGEIYAGQYKVVVSINDEVSAEQEFKVK